MLETLLPVYAPLIAWTVLGILLRRSMLALKWEWMDPRLLGRWMYWVGVPVSTVGFLQGVDLSGSLWISPLMCWVAVAISVVLSLLFLGVRRRLTSQRWQPEQWGSFQLSAMLGNTGYIGFPVCLAVGGTAYFGWALFYDMLGTLFSAYGLGIWIASRYGATHFSQRAIVLNILKSPAVWGFVVGLLLHPLDLPVWMEASLYHFAWAMIPVSLVLLGMRSAQMGSFRNWIGVGGSLFIRLLAVPGLVALILIPLPIPVIGKLLITLQSGMPPAVATLVLTEEFNLDREVTTGAIAIGYALALLTLPLWIGLWGDPSGLGF